MAFTLPDMARMGPQMTPSRGLKDIRFYLGFRAQRLAMLLLLLLGLLKSGRPASQVGWRGLGGDLEAKLGRAVAYMSPRMKASGGLKVLDSTWDFMLDAFGPAADP